jgi:hypothetical protein
MTKSKLQKKEIELALRGRVSEVFSLLYETVAPRVDFINHRPYAALAFLGRDYPQIIAHLDGRIELHQDGNSIFINPFPGVDKICQKYPLTSLVGNE